MKPKFYFLGLIFLLISGIGAAQTGIVSGFVTDSQDSSLANVNVYIIRKGKVEQYSLTNKVGYYYFEGVKRNSTIIFSKESCCRESYHLKKYKNWRNLKIRVSPISCKEILSTAILR